ncbi:hypothetical protein CPB84DRAFT_719918 [Gymnopilus junonius]|uniref:Uncharacterized protein n=1 Tax=Gymnopilus junonius TaxID=109634 RepID=A0A9P5NTX4_GYMJU|nr:hypothetical protein CPB84DRAFT_719918 [Gymnopilus junonius]
MDGSPRPEPRPTADSTSPTLSIPSPAAAQPASNASLAALLSEAYRDAESLRRELAQTRKRAEKLERIYQILHIADIPTSPPSTASAGGVNGDQAALQSPKHTLQLKAVIDEYEDRLARAEAARDESEARKRDLLDGWDKLEQYLSQLEVSGRDARVAFRSFVMPDGTTSGEGSKVPMRFTSPSPFMGAGAAAMMPPPGGVLRSSHSSRHHHAGGAGSSSAASSSSRVAFPLPPHPNPTPTSVHPPPGTRRPRTPSLDSMHGATQPPSKRSRAGVDDYRGREPRPSYSESYVSSIQQQQGPLYSDRHAAQQLHLQQRQGVAEPRIIDRKYRSSSHIGGGGHHHNPNHPPRPGSPSHSRSGSQSSASSMDVDELLLKTAGEENGGPHTNGNGPTRGHWDLPPPHPSSAAAQQQQQQQQQYLNSRRRNDRDPENLSITTTTTTTPPSSSNPYPPPQSQSQPAPGYPTSQAAPSRTLSNLVQGAGGPGAAPGGGGIQGQAQAPGQNHVYTTHVFAPVVTGAPTKKSKYPNTAVGTGATAGVPGRFLSKFSIS